MLIVANVQRELNVYLRFSVMFLMRNCHNDADFLTYWDSNCILANRTYSMLDIYDVKKICTESCKSYFYYLSLHPQFLNGGDEH